MNRKLWMLIHRWARLAMAGFLILVWCVARVWVKAPSGRQRFNVLGALNAVTKEVITVVNSTYIHSLSGCALLYKLAALKLPVPITMVLDNAPYQRCALVQTLAKELSIELLFLPPYSPNLNLIERLWKFVKKQCLYAKYYRDFGSFTDVIQRCLADTHTLHKEALRSLIDPPFPNLRKGSVMTVRGIPVPTKLLPESQHTPLPLAKG